VRRHHRRLYIAALPRMAAIEQGSLDVDRPLWVVYGLVRRPIVAHRNISTT
jgi:hypothetical protein